jgi:hypothetical protein
MGRDGRTTAEPPAAVCGFSLAASPMTAMERRVRELRGSSEPAFLSRTVPSSAIFVDRARWAGVLTTAFFTVAGSGSGCSNRPIRNMAVRMWVTMVSRVAVLTEPFSTAALSLLLKYEPKSWSRGVGLVSLVTPGISWSSPDLAALTVLCRAPQSDITMPSNFHASRSVSVSSSAFSQA